jgi:CubicO group peptidase (beta-lactamase class C family)
MPATRPEPSDHVTALADRVDTAVRADPRLRHIQSVLVSHAGDIVCERYFRDRRADDLTNLHSVTKSVVASLAGIAIHQGAITLTTTIGDVLDAPELSDDERKQRVSVEHLLTMTSGLDASTPYDIDEIADRGESWLSGVLAAPLIAEPGTTFAYNNGAAHVLGIVLARATQMPLKHFAERHLFVPLGIEEYRWPEDPDGNALAYGHLELRPRDLLQLGQLYLDGERPLLGADFVAAATTAHTTGGPPEGASYGYLWWIAEDAGRSSFFAGGYGGQYVTVVPDLELVVVTTGDVDVYIPTSADPRELVATAIIPAMT